MAKKDTKIIYCEIDEEVSTVIDRLRSQKLKKIIFVFPKHAVALSSLVSLKLLRKQAHSLKKKITIITPDKKAARLCHTAKLIVHRDLDSLGLEDRSHKDSKQDGLVRIVKPLSTVVQDSLGKGKKSIQDILKKRQESHHKTRHIPVYKTPAYDEQLPNKKIMYSFVAVSLLILLAVFSFVLPRATIIIEPSSETLTYVTNIKFGGLHQDKPTREQIRSITLEDKVSLEHTYKSTGVASEGSRASGFVTLYNNTSRDWPLITRTRLRTEDGMIFRMQSGLTIPRFSSIQANVVADELDEGGQIIGERGNIGPSHFTIPGLRHDNQSLVFAKSTEPFTGGITKAQVVISDQDLDAARKDIIDRGLDKARQTLRRQLALKMQEQHLKNFKLLEDKEAMIINVDDIKVSGDHQTGDPVTDFKITASISVKGFAYDVGHLRKLLRQGLVTRVSPNMVLRKVAYDDVKLKFINLDPATGVVKMEGTIAGITSFDIADHYISQIKESITGKDVADAREELQKQEFIAKAQLKMWPFWLKKIPATVNNIRVKERYSY